MHIELSTPLNPIPQELIQLKSFMEADEGWGREQGRKVYNNLLSFVESKPGVMLFIVTLKDVSRMDISFASETIVELARRFRGTKGFALQDVSNADLAENIDAAASKKSQPIVIREGQKLTVVGPKPTEGTREAFEFAMRNSPARAAEFVDRNPNLKITNASMKFKQLWEQGFLLRREDVGVSGGTEFLYFRIG